MNSWHSYPSIYALGHKAIANLLDGPVIVEEKIDGSQFSFGVSDLDGAIMLKSKGAILNVDAPEKMFERAVATVRGIAPTLTPGWTYRAEYLAKPKHNTLAYDRTPARHLIVFDINTGHEEYMGPEAKAAEAARVGLECVPVLATGALTLDSFRALLDTVSVLGGQKIEGVVVKPALYDVFGLDKKVLLGKFVSEMFKEAHSQAWKESNPTQGDVLERLAAVYGVQGRWQKAVQHLTEAGMLEGSPRDIGALIKEIPADIEKECADEIKEKLFEWAWPHVRRMTTRGFPQWYKEQLLKQAFEVEPNTEAVS